MCPIPSARWLLPALLSLCVLVTNRARAQSCHAPSLREADGNVWRVSLAAEAASYENSHFQGEYQGLRLGVMHARRWLLIGASVPYYRLVRNGLTEQGPGDVATDLRVPLLRFDDLGLTAGPELAVTFPSGNATRDLGMGHTMLMPGAFVALTHARLILVAQLAYGRAVGGGHGVHHHGGAGPIVNPMSQSEIEHSLSMGVVLVQPLRLTARVFGAVPLVDDTGLSREVLSMGVQVVGGALDLSVEQQLPLVGTPFGSKTQLSLAAQW